MEPENDFAADRQSSVEMADFPSDFSSGLDGITSNGDNDDLEERDEVFESMSLPRKTSVLKKDGRPQKRSLSKSVSFSARPEDKKIINGQLKVRVFITISCGNWQTSSEGLCAWFTEGSCRFLFQFQLLIVCSSFRMDVSWWRFAPIPDNIRDFFLWMKTLQHYDGNLLLKNPRRQKVSCIYWDKL